MTVTIEYTNLMLMIMTIGILSVLPLGAVLLWKCKTHGKMTSVLGGIVGFILFARILEAGVHLFFIFLDNPVSRMINGSTALYTLYGCAMAGIFEETGRYIMFRFVLKNEKSPQTAVGYGLGHGGIEVYVNVVLGLLMMLGTAVRYLKGGMEAVGENNTALLFSVASFTASTYVYYIVERVAAMAFHVAASVIVFTSLRQRKPQLLLLAVVLHGIVDIPAALTQRGVLSIGLYEVIFSLLCAGVCVIAWKIWKALKETGMEEEGYFRQEEL